MGFVVPKIQKIDGDWIPPGDKSISHRALILSAIATGSSRIKNGLRAGDVDSTIHALKRLGVNIVEEKNDFIVRGVSLRGLKKFHNVIDIGNSGTTLRLLTGVLGAQSFSSVIDGDESIHRRPMNELIDVLRKMGVSLSGVNNGERAPIYIKPAKKNLRSTQYEPSFPSAQIKSALLLAGLYAEGVMEIKEGIQTRDHTERLLKKMGACIEVVKGVVRLNGGNIEGTDIEVPGDISSSSFLLTLALILPESSLSIRGVGLNDTRTGILEIIQKMGGKISIIMTDQNLDFREPVGDVFVKASPLVGTTVSAGLTIRAIDEIPLVALMATQASGQTLISNAKVLRYKETNRLQTIAKELKKMGANVVESNDGLIIEGPTPLKGARVESHGDHRIAMMLVIAGILAEGKTEIDSIESIQYSFPTFLGSLKSVSAE